LALAPNIMDYCLNFSSIAFGHEVEDLFRLFDIVVNTSDGQDTAEGAEEGLIRFLGVPRLGIGCPARG